MQFPINNFSKRLSILTKNYSLLTVAIILVLALVAWSCDDDDDVRLIEDQEWSLVWSDEFDGADGSLPDASKWNFDVGTDWGNAQLEYDTDRAENASITTYEGEKMLAITARREAFAGSGFTSARITTLGKFDQTYGRFEARIKMPWGPGIWPAFWLLGSNCDEQEWPLCGEIDVMEYRGQEPNLIHGSIHGPGYSAENAVTKAFGLENGRFDTDFFIYAVDWAEDYINFYVNDILYQTITPEDADGEWVYDHDFHIILNVAVGGNYVGFPTADTNFPQTMLVDWVRVYEAR